MTSRIILEGPHGQREVEEGTPYRLERGERVKGVYSPPGRPKANILVKMASYFGMELADFVRFAAVTLNNSGLVTIDLNCKACDLRYKVLYSVKQLGIIKCMSLIARSLRGRLTQEDEKQIEESFNGPTTDLH